MFRPLMFEMNAMLLPSGDQVAGPTWRVIQSLSIVRVRGSTCALGFEEICLGSVTACGAGKVWAAASETTVLIRTTIAKGTRVRMKDKASGEGEEKVYQSAIVNLAVGNCIGPSLR